MKAEIHASTHLHERPPLRVRRVGRSQEVVSVGHLLDRCFNPQFRWGFLAPPPREQRVPPASTGTPSAIASRHRRRSLPQRPPTPGLSFHPFISPAPSPTPAPSLQASVETKAREDTPRRRAGGALVAVALLSFLFSPSFGLILCYLYRIKCQPVLS